MSASTARRESSAEFDSLPPLTLLPGMLAPMTEGALLETAAWREARTPCRPAPLVYLAGPVAGLSWAQATGWRDRAADLLAPDILTLSPLRAERYLNGETSIRHTYPQHAASTPRAILHKCRTDTRRCDLVLANLTGASRVSIGTCVEFGWADAWGKPLVLVLSPGDLHDHPMLTEIAGWVVPTLDEACALVRALLLP